MKTGVAGCGRMGFPMAMAMHNAGVKTVGFDIKRSNDFEPLEMDFDPERFARDVVVMFTVVRDEHQTDDLLFNQQAVLEHAKALEYLVVCSTLSPTYVRNLRSRIPDHIELIDAPMSGAAIAAQEARLSFMIGGKSHIIDELMLHFSAMGNKFHLMGEYGSGMTAKVLNNLVAASSMAATRTALDWGIHNDISPDALLDVMNDSSGQTWISRNFEEIEFSADGYALDNSIGLLSKDIAAAVDASPGQESDLANALIETIRNLEPLQK